MKSWKFATEINASVKTLILAYLATMHSTTITIVFENNNKVYYHDLTTDEILEIVRTNGKKLMTQKLTKSRLEKFLENSVEFATTADIENTKNLFPNYATNNGYISEFVYRMIVTNENANEITKSNKSIAYDKASDTKDNKQIKDITNGATFTSFEYLLKVCEKKKVNNLNEIKNAIETLNRIYN